MNPKYLDYGMSFPMGDKLRKEVEDQLTKDFQHYCPNIDTIKFDWSDSCIEGKCGNWLDGSLDRYSGINLYDKYDRYLGDGWMEFILDNEKKFFKVYWDFLDIILDGKIISLKETPGLPKHVQNLLPLCIIENLERYDI